MTKNIIVFISGNGSNLQVLLDHLQNSPMRARIVAVVSNKANAYGLQRAKQHNIPCHVLTANANSHRDEYDRQLLQIIAPYQADLLVLAGFMRILTPLFVNAYRGKIINLHPSLLPLYPGLHTHQRAIDNGDKQHGASVHFVTEQLDAGPIILQGVVDLAAGETVEQLAAKVQQQEHLIYPIVVDWFIDNRLTMQNQHAWLDNKLIPISGYKIADIH